MFQLLNFPFHFSPTICFYFFIKNFQKVLIDVVILGEVFSFCDSENSSVKNVIKIHHTMFELHQPCILANQNGEIKFRYEKSSTCSEAVKLEIKQSSASNTKLLVFLNLSRIIFICVLLSGTFS